MQDIRSSVLVPRNRSQRAMLLLTLIAGTSITFFYWRLPARTSEYSIRDNEYKSPETVKLDFAIANDQTKPIWTWTCQKNGCERIMASTAQPLQSLTTCNMLCSSEPIWPKPSSFKHSKTIVPVSVNDFKLSTHPSPPSEIVEVLLKKAFNLMIGDISLLEKESSGDNKSTRQVIVAVNVKEKNHILRLDTDESYTLKVMQEGLQILVDIKAQTFYGARHAFETLSQLVWMDEYASTLMTFDSVQVEDAPRFKYRGLLLDTARNFFPVTDIMRTLDAMGANKLNTFHWHATDSQSFPLQLKSVPQLSQYGSYGPAAIYTTEDIKAIVQRARLRGIRVVIEIDAPAHVGRAWGWGHAAGYGDLAYCIEEEPWIVLCGEPPCGQLNPKNKYVYEILEKIYAEIIELTEVDDVFHLGGDEVRIACWELHMDMNDTHKNTNSQGKDVWMEFMELALKALERANGGKAPNLTLIWSSNLTKVPYLKKLAKHFGVQYWNGSDSPEIKAIGEAKLRTVISNSDAWYLDCGFGSWRDSSNGHCPKYRFWTVAYENRPWYKKTWLVEGGTVCQWSEELGDFGLDTRLWPRAAAVAERQTLTIRQMTKCTFA